MTTDSLSKVAREGGPFRCSDVLYWWSVKPLKAGGFWREQHVAGCACRRQFDGYQRDTLGKFWNRIKHRCCHGFHFAQKVWVFRDDCRQANWYTKIQVYIHILFLVAVSWTWTVQWRFTGWWLVERQIVWWWWWRCEMFNDLKIQEIKPKKKWPVWKCNTSQVMLASEQHHVQDTSSLLYFTYPITRIMRFSHFYSDR